MGDCSRRDFCSGRNLARMGLGFFDSLRAGLREAMAPADTPAATPPPATPTPGQRGQATIPLHRPPGAIEESAFLDRCSRCLDCAAACPHGSIIAAPIRFRGAAGTPMIDAQNQPCLDCADRPCAAACPSGALDQLLPSRMGLAQIDTHACIATSSFCSSCVERCPVPGAIRMEQGRPVIDPAACTGCGVCAHVCPAPQPAIRLLPNRARPVSSEA